MKKILFTEPNRIATVEERKTNTRRIVNPQPKGSVHDSYGRPRYKVGETVYIAEPYKILTPGWSELVIVRYGDGITRYCKRNISDSHEWVKKRDKEMFKSKSGFCNKMFMPEWAARTFIKITGAECERLQDISDEDCFREGIYDDGAGYVYEPNGIAYSTPREAYAAEIDMINGKGTWDSNPYVWSYYYKHVNK